MDAEGGGGNKRRRRMAKEEMMACNVSGEMLDHLKSEEEGNGGPCLDITSRVGYEVFPLKCRSRGISVTACSTREILSPKSLTPLRTTFFAPLAGNHLTLQTAK